MQNVQVGLRPGSSGYQTGIPILGPAGVQFGIPVRPQVENMLSNMQSASCTR